MSSPIVTPGSVTSAAEAIVALGEKPTVDRIRAYLQGGSPNKILPLLREWKATNQQPRTDTGAEQPHSAAPEPVREIVTLETLPLRANDDETQAPRKFRLESVGELSRGHAQ